jgi:hypothetical protein
MSLSDGNAAKQRMGMMGGQHSRHASGNRNGVRRAGCRANLDTSAEHAESGESIRM